ncbi:uncharacterized protein LOC111639967 isoform X2 [Centruroides sculpturatus]|nr:uncharacterized protein LOC111639967 isoform X2 [Centruroides sculpturatus]
MEMHPVDDDEPNSELIIQDSSIADSKQSENCLPKKVSDKLSENSVIVLDDGILQKDDEVIYMGSKRGNIPRSRITGNFCVLSYIFIKSFFPPNLG